MSEQNTQVYSYFNRPPAEGIGNFEPTKTQQQFAEDANINQIMEKALRTGFLPTSEQQGQFRDLTGYPDYHTSLMLVQEAEDRFMELPAKIRERFSNDPGQLLAFLEDPTNRKEGEELGLFEKQETVIPTVAKPEPVAAPAPSPT